MLPNGMADVAQIAGPRYKLLPQKEKERFERMANSAKAKMSGKSGDAYRMDNQHNIVAHRKDEYTELDKRRLKEKKDIIKDWPEGKDLKKVAFHFIHFHTLCPVEEPKDCLPCEIAVIEYSIERGITKQLHRFIEPGQIMAGYLYTCKSHSESTHQIPVEGFELADANYRGLWMQIENFINPGREKEEHPPLFCLGASGNFKVVELCLEWIYGRACLGEPNRIRKVYEIESLFQEMHAHIGHQVSKSRCVDLLTSSEWEFEPNTRCQYHEDKEVKFCSLGIVNRYAYAISDNICNYFDVLPTKNHLPMRDDLGLFRALPLSAMPVCPYQEARMSNKPNMLVKPRQAKPKPVHTQPELEEDYQELRRPKLPDYQESGGGSGWSNRVVGGMQISDSDFPEIQSNSTPIPAYQPMGRSLSMPDYSMSAAQPIGRGLSSMQQPMERPPAPMGRGMINSYISGLSSESMMPGLGRGLSQGLQGMGLTSQPMGRGAPGLSLYQSSANPPRVTQSFPAGYEDEQEVDEFDDADEDDQEDEIVPLRRPGQAPARSQAPPPGLQKLVTPQQPLPATISQPPKPLPKMTGRGRGNILDNLLTRGIKPGINIGRGYAPPNWVEDGTMKPVRQ